ncbi:MAG: phospholipid carrier-dependent glycosyltransferase [Chloroflexaceae bacterium]|nr:phospholipid carrier-dependent glycosyltransferase [Chloroflexaceae bacterium]
MDTPRRTYPTLHTAYLVLLALVALLLRVLDLGGFVTLDEVSYWFGRSERLLAAIQSGQFADTAITSHPGVTTMWLGATAIWLRETLQELILLPYIPFGMSVAILRLPAALVHTAGILLGYHLLRRLLPASVAMLAALLWAADPFVLAFSRILHTDALLMTFATLSLLAALVYWQQRAHVGYLVLSAGCGALAVLSKSPGLIVLPMIAAIALLSAWEQTAPPRHPSTRYTSFALCVLRFGFIWGGVFALTMLLVWPATWAAPLRVYELLRFGVQAEGAEPHMQGNFFLGRPTDVPGPLFYPAVLALRSTPITLVGLLLLPLAWRWDGLDAAQRRTLALLAGYVLLFTLAMSLFPKQFNRYLVPVFPALDVLAAVGLWGVASATHNTQNVVFARTARLVPLAAGLLTIANAFWWHPYGVAAFNQMLGGAQTGAATFVIGWGEGMEQVADWLNVQPDITGVTVASTMQKTLQPYLRQRAQTVTPPDGALADNTGYVMIDVSHVQRQRLRPPLTDFYPHAVPLHVVTIRGVDYAWIYDVPAPVAQKVGAYFDSQIALQGYTLDTASLRSGGGLALLMQWQAATPPAQDYLLFVHLLDSSGQRISQIDIPPAGPDQPTSSWEVGRYLLWRTPLPAPADLPAGEYWLALGLYDAATFARLPVDAAPPPHAPDAGGHALLLPVRIP